MRDYLKNYLSTVSFILIAFFAYSNNTFFQKTFSLKFIDFSIESLTVYKIVVLLYIIFLIPFYKNFDGKSKARKVLNYLRKKSKDIKYNISKKERVSILAWIVKLFFAPLMIMWSTDHIITFMNNSYLSYNEIDLITENFILFFNKHFFYFFFVAILSIDTFYFTIGYLFESKKLKNKIKSVDPTIMGWFFVLICYPPFNSYTTQFIGWFSKDFPQFTNDYIHIILNISILILMGIYSRASVALGFKASNLTNRGIVKRGPYKYIRHPAYITKNTAWWIGGMPLLVGNIISGQPKHFFIVLLSLIGWSTIYYFRAITEEKHLSMDPDYIEYKKKVKYKFIPGIY